MGDYKQEHTLQWFQDGISRKFQELDRIEFEKKKKIIDKNYEKYLKDNQIESSARQQG